LKKKMSLPVLPNPSNLVAVALVINRTRDGANLVFHYPPQTSADAAGPSAGPPSDDLAQDDIILERLSTDPSQSQSQGFHPGRGAVGGLIPTTGSGVAPWELVTGFPAGDLATLLSPGRLYHKTLFQVSLDTLYYVSCPIHVPETGTWKKKRKKKTKDSLPSRKIESTVTLPDLASSAKLGPEDPLTDDAALSSERGPEIKLAAEEEEENKVSSMTMFNVVFILNPKQHEVKELVNGLYSNIIKKLNKAYKYAQQHSDFVWKESKQIIRLKEKAREESRLLRARQIPQNLTLECRNANAGALERDTQGVLSSRLDPGGLPVPVSEQDHKPPARHSQRARQPVHADSRALLCPRPRTRGGHEAARSVADVGEHLHPRGGLRRARVPGEELCSPPHGQREEDHLPAPGRPRSLDNRHD
jgi:hypothetical protein